MAAISRLVRRTTSISSFTTRCSSSVLGSDTNSQIPPFNTSSLHPKTPLSCHDPKDRNVQWAFLGCPGVGKGTYAGRLSKLIGVPHIATGDLVRDELASSGPLSAQVLSSTCFTFLFLWKIYGFGAHFNV